MPIKIRLTLAYTALLGGLLITVNIIFFSALYLFIGYQVDVTLKERALQIEKQIVIIDQNTILLPSLNAFTSPSIVAQIVRADGKIVSTTPNMGHYRFPHIGDMWKSILNGQTVWKTVYVDDTPVRIYSIPIITFDESNEQVIGVIQVGRSMAPTKKLFSEVLFLLMIITIVGLIISSLVGAMLAYTALRPIEQITQTANQIISAQDLGQRLPEPKNNDELGRLTITMNKMLERLDKFFQAQVRLSADVSHELRTPLTAIRGNVDLLRRGAASDPDELKEALTIIDSELDRMSRIVADLLLLSQADAGLSLRLANVEMDTIILDAYREARVISNGVNIQLGHEDQVMVKGDADRLKQLLINLITNAVKYTPSDGTVTLSLYRDPVWVRVIVTDTGRGIAPKELPHIFERFYQVDGVNTKGNGLGLSIAQWIAQAHDGEITVTSEINKGSTFTLWLPVKASHIETKPSLVAIKPQ